MVNPFDRLDPVSLRDMREAVRDASLFFGGPKASQRAPQWKAFREAHLLRHPACSVCGGVEELEVHHRQPWHLFPEKELDPENCMTACVSKRLAGMNCHLLLHGGNWKKYSTCPEGVASVILSMLKTLKA
jgi:hypothetical protein